MSDRLPAAASNADTVIDAFAFAREGGRLARATPVAALTRLAASLRPDHPAAAGAVDWAVDGSVGPTPEGRPGLWLELQARFAAPMQCMRCLETVVLPIELRRRFKIEHDAALVDAEPLDQDAYDAILGSPRFELLELLEDEALLALPFSPMHARCGLPDGAPDAQQAPAAEHPFAALAALKRARDTPQ